MVDELAGKPIGERIRIIRTRQGKSRAAVAGLIGRSESWLKKVERLERESPRFEDLVALGRVLGVRDLTELVGDQAVPIGMGHQALHVAVPAIREAIEETPLRVNPDPWPDPTELKRRVDSAWRVWHSSRTPRADVGRVMPELIRECERAMRVLDGEDRRKAAASLSEVYALAEQVLAWVAEPALVWLVSDRCMRAAQQADDPLVIAGAAWVLGNVHRSANREEEALLLADQAASLLTPHLESGSDEQRAMWGALRLHGAITAARMSREGDALHRLDQGDEMARRMPDGYAHPWTLFGSVNVDFTGVSVTVDLQQSRSAVTRASDLDPDRMPSIDRRARLWLEMARSYHQAGDQPGTLAILQRASSVSLEAMRSHPISRSIAGELVSSGGPMVQREARALARDFGLTV